MPEEPVLMAIIPIKVKKEYKKGSTGFANNSDTPPVHNLIPVFRSAIMLWGFNLDVSQHVSKTKNWSYPAWSFFSYLSTALSSMIESWSWQIGLWCLSDLIIGAVSFK